MSLSKKLLPALVVAGLLALGSAAYVSASDEAPQLEIVRVAQFGKAKFLLYLPLYIAMEEGLFAKQGIEIDLHFAGNDDQVFASVISGSVDFGVGDPVFAAISKEKGGPGKVVALMITKLGLSGYTNNPDIREITDPSQLDGLRVSSLPEPSTTYTLLKQIQADSAPNMQIVQAGFGAHLATLEAGKVDIAVDLEPTTSIAESKGYPVVFDLAAYIEPQAITGITTTEDVIAEKSKIVQKLVNGLHEALVIMNFETEVPVRVASKLFPELGEDVIRAAVARMQAKHMYPKSPEMVDKYWQRTLQTRVRNGELKALQPTDKAVENRFAFRATAG